MCVCVCVNRNEMFQPAMVKPRAAPPPPPPAGNRPKPPVEDYMAARQVTSGTPHASDPRWRGAPPLAWGPASDGVVALQALRPPKV